MNFKVEKVPIIPKWCSALILNWYFLIDRNDLIVVGMLRVWGRGLFQVLCSLIRFRSISTAMIQQHVFVGALAAGVMNNNSNPYFKSVLFNTTIYLRPISTRTYVQGLRAVPTSIHGWKLSNIVRIPTSVSKVRSLGVYDCVRVWSFKLLSNNY